VSAHGVRPEVDLRHETIVSLAQQRHLARRVLAAHRKREPVVQLRVDPGRAASALGVDEPAPALIAVIYGSANRGRHVA
jgi:hypothetical protein